MRLLDVGGNFESNDNYDDWKANIAKTSANAKSLIGDMAIN
jgi:hypothetical protein